MENQQPLQQPTASQPQQTIAPRPKRPKSPLLVTLLAIILVIGIGYGTYSWQHGKVTTLNAKVKSLQSQSTAQSNKITNLNNKVSALSKAATQSKSTITSTSITGPFDQTAAITQAVKDYKGNAGISGSTVTIYGVTGSGNAAYGVISLPGGGGGSWLAINSGGSWSVISQGQVGICKSQGQQYNLPSIWITETDC
jgi:hypothetical protein